MVKRQIVENGAVKWWDRGITRYLWWEYSERGRIFFAHTPHTATIVTTTKLKLPKRQRNP